MSVLCVFMFLYTLIKKLNLKFKIKKKLPWDQKRDDYLTVAFKMEVVNYTEKRGNRAGERHFGSPTEKMV